MPKTADLRARIEPERKAAGREILDQLGMTESEFLMLAWSQMIRLRGLPFPMRLARSRRSLKKATKRSTATTRAQPACK